MTSKDVAKMLISTIKEQISKKSTISIAIDGYAASGKTTVSNIISNELNASIVHMDDFFPRPYQRTKERYETPGGNVDYERFLIDVAQHISLHDDFEYRRFNCGEMMLSENIVVPKSDILIIEGTYACHEKLIGYYDITVFLSINDILQQERIANERGEDKLSDFNSKWIPLEREYFKAQNIEAKCDMVFDMS